MQDSGDTAGRQPLRPNIALTNSNIQRKESVVTVVKIRTRRGAGRRVTPPTKVPSGCARKSFYSPAIRTATRLLRPMTVEQPPASGLRGTGIRGQLLHTFSMRRVMKARGKNA